MTDWLSYWRDYSKKTGELTWRIAKPSDREAIERIRLVSERYMKQRQRKANLFEFPVMLALVAEDSSGEVVDLLFVEAQVEVIKMGCSEAGFEESAALESDLGAWLKDLRFDCVIATCPIALKDRMWKVFRKLKFWPLDDGLVRWRRWL
jgi:hypothetical protein